MAVGEFSVAAKIRYIKYNLLKFTSELGVIMSYDKKMYFSFSYDF